VVIGVFDDRAAAERTVDELSRNGFSDDQIGFATRDAETTEVRATGSGDTDTSGVTSDTDTRGGTREGLVMGAVTGASLGSIVGAAVAVLVPGIGPVLAGGILTAALTGAAVGATTGGIVGALRDWGFSEHEATYYQSEFEAGRILVTARPADMNHRQIAIEVIRRNGGRDADSR
jgi:hypothetical protein